MDDETPREPHHARKPHDQLFNEFVAYHAANPRVYQLVCQFAQEAIDNGYTRFGIGAIWERVRWEVAMTNHSNIDAEDFKMPNNHRAHYARMWLADHPKHNSYYPFFQTCELRSLRPNTPRDRYGREI